LLGAIESDEKCRSKDFAFMPIYIALLRGINIGPHKRMKMEKLISTCAACGWADARTCIQSGNVVFKAPKGSPDSLSKKLEAQILADFGFSSDVIVRSREELQEIVAGNSLLRVRAADPQKMHVLFLSSRPEPAAVKKLQALTLAPDQVRVADTEIYFYFPNGVSVSSLWKHSLDKVLGVSCTMRNWNTVTKLHEIAEEMGH